MTPQAIRDLAVAALEDLKAEDIQVIEVAELTAVADYMIVASGSSTRHVKSIADNVVLEAKKQKHQPLGVEGADDPEWILVDLGDVVVHVLTPKLREFYSIEKLWQGPFKAIDEEDLAQSS